jgi:glycosyltransferase involved in cell wall biosynthesis
MTLSVLLPVYHNESAEYLRQSLESVAAQTVRPDEMIIVKDGPVGPEVDAAIDSHRGKLPIVTVQLENNVGLGLALNIGLIRCRGDLVARMDADDICLHDRLEKQLAFLEKNPHADVIGGAIAEFDSDYKQIETIRRMPCAPDVLAQVAKWRNPLNHMTVMFRKAAVLAAGNYRSYWGFEDYDLWARMLMRGGRLYNLEDVLVYVRCGNGMQKRRGGWRYLQEEAALQHRFVKMGFISKRQFVLNLIVRAPVRVVPVSLRTAFYQKVLRQREQVAPQISLPVREVKTRAAGG